MKNTEIYSRFASCRNASLIDLPLDALRSLVAELNLSKFAEYGKEQKVLKILSWRRPVATNSISVACVTSV